MPNYTDRTDLVKCTLLGSILSNMLLVQGMAFFSLCLPSDGTKLNGSVHYDRDDKKGTGKEVHFATKGVNVSMGMLLFCCMSFALPSIFTVGQKDQNSPELEHSVLRVSRLGAG